MYNLAYFFLKKLFSFALQWLVLIIEVRPSLLYGEPERCLLEDITKVNLVCGICAPFILLT